MAAVFYLLSAPITTMLRPFSTLTIVWFGDVGQERPAEFGDKFEVLHLSVMIFYNLSEIFPSNFYHLN